MGSAGSGSSLLTATGRKTGHRLVGLGTDEIKPSLHARHLSLSEQSVAKLDRATSRPGKDPTDFDVSRENHRRLTDAYPLAEAAMPVARHVVTIAKAPRTVNAASEA